jgi:hypothetical protein
VLNQLCLNKVTLKSCTFIYISTKNMLVKVASGQPLLIPAKKMLKKYLKQDRKKAPKKRTAAAASC